MVIKDKLKKVWMIKNPPPNTLPLVHLYKTVYQMEHIIHTIDINLSNTCFNIRAQTCSRGKSGGRKHLVQALREGFKKQPGGKCDHFPYWPPHASIVTRVRWKKHLLLFFWFPKHLANNETYFSNLLKHILGLR